MATVLPSISPCDCCSQAGSDFRSCGGSGGDKGADDVVPALGLAWSHCINTRVGIRRISRSADSDATWAEGQSSPPPGPARGGASGWPDVAPLPGPVDPSTFSRAIAGPDGDVREVRLVWSPWAGPGGCRVVIRARGVEEFVSEFPGDDPGVGIRNIDQLEDVDFRV